MNIPDLSKIDIKDIDLNKLKDQLLGRKDLLIQGGLVLVSLIVLLSLFNNSQTEIRKFKSQIDVLESKTSSIADYTKARNETSTFLKEVPQPLLDDQIIDFITDLADKNNVKIQTISPAKVEDKEVLVTTTMQFSLETWEYKDMIRFIDGIERSKSLLQIKMCTAQAQMGADNRIKKNENPLINFRIEVTSVQAKL